MNMKTDSVYQIVTSLCTHLAESFKCSATEKERIIKKLRSSTFGSLLASPNPGRNHGQLEETISDAFAEIFNRERQQGTWNLDKHHHVVSLTDELQLVGQSQKNLACILEPTLRFLILLSNDNQDEGPHQMSTSGAVSLYEPQRGQSFPKLNMAVFELPLELTQSVSTCSEDEYAFDQLPGMCLPTFGRFIAPPGTNSVSTLDFGMIPDLTEPRELVIPRSRSFYQDEGYETPDTDRFVSAAMIHLQEPPSRLSLWSGIEKIDPPSRYRTWETRGQLEPPREPPFLSEMRGSLTHLMAICRAQHIVSQFHRSLVCSPPVLRLISWEQLRADIKNLLLAIRSTVFSYDKEGESFVLQEGIYIEGLSPETVASYCNYFIDCGNCVWALREFVSCDPDTKKLSSEGLVFEELCKSIGRYLQCYMGIVIDLPHSLSLIELIKYMAVAKRQLVYLRSLVCRPGLPAGGGLVSYLYAQVPLVTRKEVAYLLYSILEACTQVYLRFLEKWMYEGECNDLYDEFFVKHQSTYDCVRARKYWVDCYKGILKDVPDFLAELYVDVLLCGKSMNLVKLCNPQDPLCRLVESAPLLQCCFDRNAIVQLSDACAKWAETCQHSFPQPLKETPVDREVIKETQEKRLLKIKEERETEVRILVDKKQKLYAELKKAMEEEGDRKEEQKRVLLAEDRKMLEQAQKADMKDTMRRDCERQSLVEYYKVLSEGAEVRRLQAESRKKQIESGQTCDELILQNEVLKSVMASTESPFSLTDDSADTDLPIVNKEHVNVNNGENIQTGNESLAVKLPFVEVEAKMEAVRNRKKVLSSHFELGHELAAEPKYVTPNKEPKEKESTEFEYELTEENKDYISMNMAILQEPPLLEVKREIGNADNGEIVKEELCVVEVSTDDNIGEISKKETVHSNKHLLLIDVIKLAAKQDQHNITCSERITANSRVHLWNNDSTDVLGINAGTALNADKIGINNLELLSEESTNEITPSLKNISYDDREFENEVLIDVDDEEKVGCYDSHLGMVDLNGRFIIDQKEVIISIGEKMFHTEYKKTRNVENIDMTSIYHSLCSSIRIPLGYHLKLANSAILRLFIEQEKLMVHIDYLRRYFFLLDFEYGRTLTYHLFNKIQTVDTPSSLLAPVSLNAILVAAVGDNAGENSYKERVSFIVQETPIAFDLTDPMTLDCFSLRYKTDWPLNIILTESAIKKYAKVFNFLLKLQHASWALNETICLLKLKGMNSSSEYREIHLYRVIMTQFVRSFQGYVNMTVLDGSWAELKRDMARVTNLDTLYRAHCQYLKRVMFKCLMNSHCQRVHSYLMRLFKAVLTFHQTLRAGEWSHQTNGEHTFSSFRRLADAFQTFIKVARFLRSYFDGYASTGYQHHLTYLVEFLTVNNFYVRT